ncbi:glycosyltransferase family 25 protein [Piscirickettsia salmonis]|uniref:glycosyltransferase family 25 protein n=1 Tax=Piscirickettsia salmonis TaxID=1238 RepID=UPI0007C8D372|nr:Lipooligosaccharide biosynthesis protein lex-1 [Piscirickettsiaceae bacterium NZ-RLO1]
MNDIFIISLKKDESRRGHVTAQFQHEKIPYEVVNAIYGKELPNETIKKFYLDTLAKEKLGRSLTVGEIGCTLSHIKCYQKIIDNNLPGAFIFEDDIMLNKHTAHAIETVRQIKKLDNNSVVLMTHIDYYSEWGKIKLTNSHNIHPINYQHILKYASRTHGYYITQKAAQNLLKELITIYQPIDIWSYYVEQNLIKLYSVVPYIVGLSSHAEESNLELERKESTLPEKSTKLLLPTLLKLAKKYLYQKFAYQISIKQILRIKKQKSFW